jgi:hypothetical protein
MFSVLLTIGLATGLLDKPAPNEIAAKAGTAVKKFSTLVKSAKTRILAGLVFPGMTLDQVHCLLGQNAVVFFPGTPKPTVLYCYYDHGINVYYVSDKNDELVVDHVTF